MEFSLLRRSRRIQPPPRRAPGPLPTIREDTHLMQRPKSHNRAAIRGMIETGRPQLDVGIPVPGSRLHRSSPHRNSPLGVEFLSFKKRLSKNAVIIKDPLLPYRLQNRQQTDRDRVSVHSKYRTECAKNRGKRETEAHDMANSSQRVRKTRDSVTVQPETTGCQPDFFSVSPALLSARRRPGPSHAEVYRTPGLPNEPN